MVGSIEQFMNLVMPGSPVTPLFALADPLLGALLAQADGEGIAAWLPALLMRIARVVIGIGLVIFVHELGHFLAAKWCGVKVEKFYVGFDVPLQIGPIKLPRTLGKFRYGETEYGIGTIPLGGYVKMLGQDDDPRKMEEENRRIRQVSASPDSEDEAAEPLTAAKLDPRSYPAKSVWQRMLIISSGVIMNLITGVMFATAAFFYGVPYVPAVVGDVTPGGPAFQAGVEPGGKVISVGGINQDDQLHFTDMATSIVLEGTRNPNQPVPVAIEYPDGVRNFQLTPAEVPEIPGIKRVGISNLRSTFLGKSARSLAIPGSTAANALTPQDAGAAVVSINGQPLPDAGQRDNVAGSLMLERALMGTPDQPIKLGLKRADGSAAEVTLPPQPMLTPGIGFAPGPITALVTGGPAEKAGVLAGDEIIAVDGNALIDAFALPSQLAIRSGSVKLTLRRSVEQTPQQLDLEIPLGPPSRTTSPISESGSMIALDRLGVAFPATAKVSSVAQGQPFQIGDEVKKVAVSWLDGKPSPLLDDKAVAENDAVAAIRQKLEQGWEFGPLDTLAKLVEYYQYFPEGTGMRVTVDRAGQIVEVDTALAKGDAFWQDRGIGLAELERMQVASGLVPAIKLGWESSKRKLGEVFSFLGLLVSGKAGANMVGGPITIFRVADQESSRGVAPLLLFLTMLSMNLAILNFLPIPALDGGHMVFLTAEAVLGRPINEKLQMQLTMIGVIALLSLMAFALFNDIRRL